MHLSTLAFAVRVYPFIPVNRGGGDYTTESPSVLTFDDGVVEVVGVQEDPAEIEGDARVLRIFLRGGLQGGAGRTIPAALEEPDASSAFGLEAERNAGPAGKKAPSETGSGIG